MPFPRLAALSVAVLAVVAAACGGNDESATTSAPATATRPAATAAAATATRVAPSATTAAAEATASATSPAVAATATAPPPVPAATEPPPAPTATEAAPVATATAVPPPPAPPAPSAETLEISQVPSIRFDKSELRATAGATITVRFNNTDTGIPHNWALYRDAAHSDAIVGANENICTGPCSGAVTFGPLEAGTYFYRCDVHPRQMNGRLVVE